MPLCPADDLLPFACFVYFCFLSNLMHKHNIARVFVLCAGALWSVDRFAGKKRARNIETFLLVDMFLDSGGLICTTHRDYILR